MVVTKIGFVTLDHEFEPEFNDPNSAKYKNLASKMKNGLENVFCNGSFVNCLVNITGFRQGSVITDFLVTINTVAGEDSDVGKHLESGLSNFPTEIDGINVSPGNFSQGNKHEELVFSINTLLHKLIYYNFRNKNCTSEMEDSFTSDLNDSRSIQQSPGRPISVASDASMTELPSMVYQLPPPINPTVVVEYTPEHPMSPSSSSASSGSGRADIGKTSF